MTVTPALVVNVPAPVSATPRLALRVIVALAISVPPLKVSWPGVALPGAVPRAESAAIEIVPPLIVVLPVNVLMPDRVSVPVPVLTRVTAPEPSESTPE